MGDQAHSERAQLEDQFDRFRLWAGDFGAYDEAGDSHDLSIRLQKVPGAQRRVSELLDRLVNLIRQHYHLANDVQSAVLLLAELPAQDVSVADRQPAIGHSRLNALVADTITRLFKLSALVASNASVDSPRRQTTMLEHAGFVPADLSNDVSTVLNKYADGQVHSANNWLLERLGKANAQRREMLLYRQLTAKTTESSKNNPSSASQHPQEEEGAQYLVRAVPQGQGSARQGLDSTPQGELSASSDENESCWSGAFNDVSGLIQRVLLVCICCNPTQTFSEAPAWRRHVLKRILPYLCTSQDCGLLLFEDKTTWIHHEMEQHRRQWVCEVCHDFQSASRHDFIEHIEHAHGDEFTSAQVKMLAKTCSRPADYYKASDCPLCCWHDTIRSTTPQGQNNEVISVTVHQFMEHLAMHLEQIALLAATSTIREDAHAPPTTICVDGKDRHVLAKGGKEFALLEQDEAESGKQQRTQQRLSTSSWVLEQPEVLSQRGKLQGNIRCSPTW
ncbi:hypothetical protein LTR10_008509 [Elasticomyces elasticus]|nr:hypothetical protein LTR10_008509 [Elasticomyces elasticus]KAK4967383.1 hypothetical protein LTR42_010732 [Elasticomyces elasticus]